MTSVRFGKCFCGGEKNAISREIPSWQDLMMKAAPNPPVEITLFFDRGVASLAAVTATSLLAHASPDRDYILHAFTVGMDAHDRGRLEALSTPRFSVRTYDLKERLAAANLREIGDNIAFQRLLLSELLPASPRVVYIDIDLVVLRDIAELFDTDLAGAPIAACVDLHMRRHVVRNDKMPANIYDGTFRDYLANALHMKDAAQTRYFNSGVLLFDLDAFRARRSSEKARAIVDGYPGKFLNRDQCAFNQLFAEEMKQLDERWNALVPVSRFRLRAAKDADSKLQLAAFNDPFILHFAGHKPWRHHARPATGLWWAYVFATPGGFSMLADFVRTKNPKPSRKAISLLVAPFQMLAALPRAFAARRAIRNLRNAGKPAQP
ncbi:MAG TPA: glycosyltransferase family 8 protein [Xanthobacteraceae bacterium]|nr:glycosyltransferase family 8 protein [Xanthobacteraceae bacterium]